ncbi:siderophore-interacting protein (plasmid) [Burkholderia sp. SFA1]|uniref:siderophore-interacting protein n=1 Tax=unclassified Caballeronia TaxID=2646786 RepID=UPI001F3704CA|nr:MULTISPECIES: siderophore-interacting protein [unclassified Caballeronia]MCE4547093.1 siderophore-interacting protein [Caballeronia sp. PC1]MCE4572434.1 siderophore-interacting protein [Caballeronia sp. CLC5]BBQ02198.1 siderophore-interacting protein [Burkholderia sp. SFA1]
MTDPILQDRPELDVTRVRHALKFRLLQVTRVQALNPHLVRVTFTGDDLDDFVSASFDDHVKLFFPAPGEAMPALPQAGPNGPEFDPSKPRPIARDFTPRRFDRAARELDIEFALHEAGPATAWAAQAAPGQQLGIGGPRGSFVIPTQFDWHLLIGDETALPAIARRLEELPEGTRVAALIEAADPSARIEFATRADLYVQWRYRNESEHPGGALLLALRETYLPDGDGYVWAAGEATLMRAVRKLLCDERGIDKKRIRASAYWKRGEQAVHETIDG